jgi:hypothetical protein
MIIAGQCILVQKEAIKLNPAMKAAMNETCTCEADDDSKKLLLTILR